MALKQLKDRRKPWQKELKTFPMSRCGCMTQETGRKLYRTPKKPFDQQIYEYAEALGITVEEAWDKYYSQRG